MIKAVLFDLDGVLWASTEAHRLAFKRALTELGLPDRLTRGKFSRVAGMTTEKAFLHWMKQNKRPVGSTLLERFSIRKRTLALRYLARRAPLQPRLTNTLRQLSRRFRIGLVSASHPRTVNLFLRRSGTRRYFDVVLSSREIRVSKPSPRGYRLALRVLNTAPHHALAVEDTLSGVASAKGAKIPVVGMRGTCAPASLRRAGAVAVVNNISDVLKLCN